MATNKQTEHVYKLKKNRTVKKTIKTFHNVEMSPAEYKRYKRFLNPHKSFVQKRSEYLAKKTAVVSTISGFTKLLCYLFLFLLFASITRKLNNGSVPSFTSLLAYLTTFDLPTIPFRNTNGLVFGFLEFIFTNALQGFNVLLKIISFLFFG